MKLKKFGPQGDTRSLCPLKDTCIEYAIESKIWSNLQMPSVFGLTLL